MLSSRSSSPTFVINTSNKTKANLCTIAAHSLAAHSANLCIPRTIELLYQRSHHHHTQTLPLAPLLPSPGKPSRSSTLGHHAAWPTGSRGQALSRLAASMQRAGGSWPHGSRHEVGLWCLRSAPLRWWPPPAEALRNRSVLVLLLHLHLLRRGVEPTLTLSCGAVSSASQNGREYG